MDIIIFLIIDYLVISCIPNLLIFKIRTMDHGLFSNNKNLSEKYVI